MLIDKKYSKLLENAKNSFLRRQYSKAMFNYSLILEKYPDLVEAKLGAILVDIANDNEDRNAQIIFNNYQILKDFDEDSANYIIEKLINAVDNDIKTIVDNIQKYKNDRLLLEKGILYEDFLSIVKSNNNFKIVFENIMFSTKIIITKKEDFLSFLSLLIENSYVDMAINYLESALKAFPNDDEILRIFEKIRVNSES